jgi:CelD/BcsL family acetyltransferase involved in cellulose biosynthesis
MPNARSGRWLFHTIDDVRELQSFRPDWLQLWSRCTDATPFQSPSWLIPWWNEFGGAFALRATTVWKSGELIGLLPLMRKKCAPDEGKLSLMGKGVSDYLDGLFAPYDRRRIAEAALCHALAGSRGWDICEIQELRPDSPLFECAIPEGLESETSNQSVCPYLDVPEHRPDGIQFEYLPAAIRRRLKRYGGRIGSSGEVEAANCENLDRLMDSLFSLHQSRWHCRGENGVFADPAVVRFHRAAAREMLEIGALRLYRLVVGSNVAASFYGFRCGAATFGYLQGFEVKMAQLSAGTVLLGHAIERAACEGSRRFDFLRGTEAYKYAWGAQNAFTYRRKIFRKNGA